MRPCNLSRAGLLSISVNIQNRVLRRGHAKVFSALCFPCCTSGRVVYVCAVGIRFCVLCLFVSLLWTCFADECAMGRNYDNACPIGGLCRPVSYHRNSLISMQVGRIWATGSAGSAAHRNRKTGACTL